MITKRRNLLKLTLLLVLVSLTFISCKKEEYKVRYDVTCGQCEISYWKDDYQFISRIKAQGNFHFEFEAEDGQKLQISAFDTTDNSTVKAEIRLNGELVASKESTGNTSTAVVAEYIIPASRN